MLLGCTHYPLLKALIEDTLLELEYSLRIVDSAEAVARAVAGCFASSAAQGAGEMRFFATDSIEKFRRLGSRFLGQELGRVELVNLGG